MIKRPLDPLLQILALGKAWWRKWQANLSEDRVPPKKVREAEGENCEDWEDVWDPPPKAEVQPEDPMGIWIGLAIVLVFASLLYLPYLGSFGLWDPWETHYGEVARHMTETQDYISPWWGSHWHRPEAKAEGAGFFSKPILLLWAMAFGIDIWGWNAFAVRIGTAIMAILGIGAAYLMGAAVWQRKTGFLMAGVLGTSPFYFMLSRQAQTDLPFVSMLLIAMAFFVIGAFGKHRNKAASWAHKAMFWSFLSLLVLPQLWLIAVDHGFSEEQRVLRPKLRARSMMDFKGAKAWRQVMGHTPHLSPKQREEMGAWSSAKQKAYIEAHTSWLPDFILEIVPAFWAFGWGLIGVIALMVLGFKKRLKATFFRWDKSQKWAPWFFRLTAVTYAYAFLLEVKYLYDQFGWSWESRYDLVFHLAKFSPLLLFVLLGALSFWIYQTYQQLKALREEDRFAALYYRRKMMWIAGLLSGVMLFSAILFFVQGRALGIQGMTFWGEEPLTLNRLTRIVVFGGYGPFLVIAWLLVMAALKFWDKPRKLGRGVDLSIIGPAWTFGISVFFAAVLTFYIPVNGKNDLLSTFGKEVAGPIIGGIPQWGPVQIGLYLIVGGLLWFSLKKSNLHTRGQYALLTFYLFTALATLAKGLLGFALPGLFALVYLLITWDWKALKRFEIGRGILTFILVGVPWYASMLILHEWAYFNRFFIHDHFKRLATGVHQIDTGTIEHFIHWLGYGLFPWAALIPIVFLKSAMGRDLLRKNDRSRARLMLSIWALFSFTLFSLASTKFHHYIFPAVPPLALLIALCLSECWEGKMKRWTPLIVIVLAGVIILGFDLYEDPQEWKNLFTYKYKRSWIDLMPAYTARLFGEPTEIVGIEIHRSFQSAALWATVGAFVSMIFLAFKKIWLRRLGILGLFVTGVGLALWALDVYMPAISPTWSQEGLWMAYWNDCHRIQGPPNADPKKIWCEESALVYKITWRGEHFYSQNEAIPIQDDKDLDYFEQYNGHTPFYIMVDRNRYCGGSSKKPKFGTSCKGGSIVTEMKKHFGKKLKHALIWDQNLKFVLVKFYPEQKGGASK